MNEIGIVSVPNINRPCEGCRICSNPRGDDDKNGKAFFEKGEGTQKIETKLDEKGRGNDHKEKRHDGNRDSFFRHKDNDYGPYGRKALKHKKQRRQNGPLFFSTPNIVIRGIAK